jgi:uncharacterized protein
MAPLQKQHRTPFVGCFKVDNQSFIYDVNTNEIMEVCPETFSEIVHVLENPSIGIESLSAPAILALQEKGYLSSHRPNGVRAACDGCLSDGQQTGITQVVLELTQSCNHRCLYCPYSAQDPGRRYHSVAAMDWDTAKAGIDLLLDSSASVEMPVLGFYGGEPLLEWELMKSCMDYAIGKAGDKRLLFTLTTNATPVTGAIAKELAARGVSVLVSLDGPEEAHNSFRKLRESRIGGYSVTMGGIRSLREAYGDTGVGKIRINAVCGPWTDYLALENFFCTNPPPEIAGLEYRLSEVSHSNVASLLGEAGEVGQVGEIVSETKRDLFLRWTEKNATGKDGAGAEIFLDRLFEVPVANLHNRSKTLLGEHLGPMGMCLPGVRKSYIQVNGDILLCERVSERFVIGNVLGGGLDLSKCKSVLDEVVEHFQERCPECIFCRVCAGCPAVYCAPDGMISEEAVAQFCSRQIKNLGEQLLWYVESLNRNANCFDFLEETGVQQ